MSYITCNYDVSTVDSRDLDYGPRVGHIYRRCCGEPTFAYRKSLYFIKLFVPSRFSFWVPGTGELMRMPVPDSVFTFIRILGVKSHFLNFLAFWAKFGPIWWSKFSMASSCFAKGTRVLQKNTSKYEYFMTSCAVRASSAHPRTRVSPNFTKYIIPPCQIIPYSLTAQSSASYCVNRVRYVLRQFIAVLYCNYHLNRNYTVILYVIIKLPQVQWRSQFLAHVGRERLFRSEACNQKPRRGPS